MTVATPQEVLDPRKLASVLSYTRRRSWVAAQLERLGRGTQQQLANDMRLDAAYLSNLVLGRFISEDRLSEIEQALRGLATAETLLPEGAGWTDALEEQTTTYETERQYLQYQFQSRALRYGSMQQAAWSIKVNPNVVSAVLGGRQVDPDVLEKIGRWVKKQLEKQA